jgi:hypothetical protein
MAEEEMKRFIGYVIAVSSLMFAGCATTAGSNKEPEFNYELMITNNFGQRGSGNALPVAIGKATEIDGSVTGDGRYLFYSSDKERGNFDIYLRSLTGIETVRITKNPSKDVAPAVSADGRYLAFVSLREDPQGDIYVLDLDNPGDILANAESFFSTDYESKARNVSQVTDVSGAPKSFKDADPVWSADDDMIAFSSTRGNDGENIWVMSRRGKNLRELTAKGGIMPAFSPDGASLVYISYRDNPQGDLYAVNLSTGADTRITNAPGLKLHPSCLKTSGEYAFTLIDKDTNGDGIVDFRDKSRIQYLNIDRNMTYPLTSKSVSSFKPRFYPVYNIQNSLTKEHISEGIVLYGEQSGENLDIDIIPETGIIPRRVDTNSRQSDAVSRQFNTALNYENNADPEAYPLALMRVYYFHSGRKEDVSVLYCSKALSYAAIEYRKLGMNDEAEKALGYLKNLSKNENSYSAVLYAATKARFEGKNPDRIFESAIDGFKKDSIFIPAVLEDLGQALQIRGDIDGAAKTYKRITEEYPSYVRNPQLNMELWRIQYRKGGEIPFSYISVLKNASAAVSDEVSFGMSEWFSRERNPDKRIALANIHRGYVAGLKDKNSQASSILDYVTAAAYFDKNDIEHAKEFTKKVLSSVNETNGLFYSANTLNARIAAKSGNPDEEAFCYFKAAKNYLVTWNRPEINTIVAGQIAYYERKGSEFESTGEYSKAADLYARYTELMKFLHKQKIFENFYNEYGPQSHIRYIDAYVASKESVDAALDELEDRYINSPSIRNEVIKVARMDFDKAHLYALAYIYTLRGAETLNGVKDGQLSATDSSVVDSFKKAQAQISWTNFIDDDFVDPMILQGWINQMIDVRRDELKAAGSRIALNSYNSAFPEYLLESNSDIYSKALDANDETRYPDREGAIHLNYANSQFVLRNFPSALEHYELAAKYKQGFGSKKEEALFRFHLSYCYWQEGDIRKAGTEMLRVYDLYREMPAVNADQMSRIKEYLALFSRGAGEYAKALDWYSSVLADVKSSEVDRSRILLDCAWLSVQLNQLNQADQYLSRAQSLLEDENEKDPVNKIRIRPFYYLYGIPVWDMGESLIIGDSKIPFSLSTERKKALALSISESIARKRGDIRKALSVSKKRIALSDGLKTSIDRETYIRALNSAGYYLFTMGDYSGAKKYFEKGWDYSTDEDVHNLEGAFVSIQNLANLEAHLVEVSGAQGEKTLSGLDSLLSKMDSYRASYEKRSFSEKLAALEKQFKEQGRSVTEADRESLKKIVSLESEKVYSELDLSRAVISFYKSEIEGGMLKPQPDAFGYYKQSAALYDNYRRAAGVFENSADMKGTTPLKRGRLLMNAAVCRMRNGMAQKSYELFGEAEKSLVPLKKNDVLWELYYKEAVLLRDMGKEIDRDYKNMALRYFAKAAEQIEEYPALSASSPEKIESFYREYAFTLAENSDVEKSFAVLEKGSACGRIISVYKMSPSFGDERDKKDYTRYCEILSKVKEKISEAGGLAVKDQGSPAMKSVTSELDSLKAQYRSHLSTVKSRNPRLYALISAETSLSSVKGTIIRAEAFGENVGVWKTGEKIFFKNFDARDMAGIYGYISSSAPSVVVYNAFTASLLASTRDGLGKFMFSASADGIRFANGSSSSDASASVSATAEWASSEQNPLRYDIVKGESTLITSLLFERKIAPAAVFVNETESPSRGILNAALYSGCSVVFGKNGGISDLVTVNSAPGSFAFGSSVKMLTDGASLKVLYAANAEESGRLLSDGDSFRAAALSLKSGPESDSIRSIYSLNRVESPLTAGKARARALSGDAEGRSFYIWLLLMNGDVQTANTVLASIPVDAVPESEFYLSIIRQARTNRLIETKIPGKSIVDAYLLNILKARYDSVSGKEFAVTGTVPRMLSDKQILLSALVSDASVPAGSEYGEEFSALKKNPSPENALNLFGGESELSLQALIYSLRKNSVSPSQLSAIDLKKTAVGNALDVLSFCEKFSAKAVALGLFENALRADRIAEETAKKNGFNEAASAAVVRSAEALNMLKRYPESLKTLNGSSQMISESDKNGYSLALAEAELYAGSAEKASALLSSMKAVQEDDAYLKDLLSAQIQRLTLIKNPETKNLTLPGYEKYMKSALSRIRVSNAAVKKDILFSGMDFLVSYYMSGGNTPRALYFEELKKQISIIFETKGVYGKLIDDARVSDFRKTIKSDCTVLYVSKNEDDIFVWLIGKDKLNFYRLREGWKTADKTCSAYAGEAGSLKGISRQVREFTALFSPVVKDLKDIKTLYVIPDAYTERIPFEIIGNDIPLAMKLNVFYLQSISDSFGTPYAGKGYLAVKTESDSMWIETDTAALNRSGIKKSPDGKNVGVIHSINAPISLMNDAVRKSGGAGVVFFRSSSDTMNGIKAVSDAGASAVLYANPVIQDVNIPVFAADFYSTAKSTDYKKAFISAQKKMVSRAKYAHPAYWAGLRLYLNGIEQ